MSIEPIKKLKASGYDNICLFYSVLSCLSISFETMSEEQRIEASKGLRENITMIMRKTSQKDLQIDFNSLKKEIKALECREYAGETSIYFLAKHFKINIIVIADVGSMYSLFFSSSGTGKYENHDNFIILYNFKNYHFEPIEIMRNTLFSYNILIKILLALETALPTGISVDMKNNERNKILNTTFIDYLRSYIRRGYNRDININKSLVGNVYKTVSKAFDV